jgi:DNA ligase (NAD+)
MNTINKLNNSPNPWILIPSLTQEELEEIIKLSSDSYYNSSISLINDEMYDILVERLKHLDPNSTVLKQTGAPIKGKKVKLPYWMGSMDKIKSDENKLNKWKNMHKGKYLVSDKLDGCSCLLTKSKGVITLYTRGDGTNGQNISHLLPFLEKTLNGIPDDIDVAVRGELIMTMAKFKKYSKVMSNARSMVAGIVNSKPEKLNKKYAKDVDFVMYEIIEPKLEPVKQFATLKNWKTNVVCYDIFEDIDIDILEWILFTRKKKSQYEIDGIIVTDNKKHPRNSSGNPTYSFAYKGMSQTADVSVIDVIWKPSKDGVLVPRIQYEKTYLSQVFCNFATGFNARFINDNKIGKGAIITIIRSGDVIPYVLDIIKPAKKIGLPTNYEYTWDKNGVNIILDDMDNNKIVIVQRLTKFLKDIEVENMSEGIVTKLVNGGYDTILKIIKMSIDDFLELDGFQQTLANKLHKNLHTKLNDLNILKLMNASNCFGRGFGERKIKKILNVYPDIVEKYSVKNSKQWKKKLMNLEGFNTITVDNFFAGMITFQKFYNSIKKVVSIKMYVSNIKQHGIFQNQVIAFTGFRNTSWKQYIESEGGRVSSTVSKNTTLVVYNDGEESTTKYKKAVSMGVKMIPKSQFGKKYSI